MKFFGYKAMFQYQMCNFQILGGLRLQTYKQKPFNREHLRFDIQPFKFAPFSRFRVLCELHA